MKYKLILIIATFSLGIAQDHVSNVMASQRTDGTKIVDISYDLAADPQFPSYTIYLEVSTDGGINYYPRSIGCYGDIGYNIFPGNNTIQLDMNQEWGPFVDVEYGQCKVKVVAEGHEIIDNLPFEMVNVPAGEYTYGEGDTIKTIPYNYQVSKYEITNAQYANFLIDAYEDCADGGDGSDCGEGSVWLADSDSNVRGHYAGNYYTTPYNYIFYNLNPNAAWQDNNYGQIEWNGTTFVVPEGYGDHPVVEVSWYGAIAFAQHYGLRIPNQYEWEKAARGNTGYNFPVGDSMNGSQANYEDSGDPWDDGTTPVGFFSGQNYDGFQTVNSSSPYGAYDIAGNVEEWTDDPHIGYEPRRFCKGGHWTDPAVSSLQSWDWGSVNENERLPYIGFRVARTISQAE